MNPKKELLWGLWVTVTNGVAYQGLSGSEAFWGSRQRFRLLPGNPEAPYIVPSWN